MKLTIGFSPCPNDTFIFDALVNHRIDTQGLSFDVRLEDVQTLNEWAIEGRLDITKISYGTLPLLLEQYVLLNSGGALGKGVGPLLISKTQRHLADVPDLSVAIPGENTTAHLLFQLAFPNARKKTFMVFHEVEAAVLSGAVDAGVIIHENRFTYQQKGLVKLIDLGEYWENRMHVPIPLGGIVAKRSLGIAVARQVDQLIRESLQSARKASPGISNYVKQHAQEMSEQVMRQHIDLYVNDFSLDLGETGRASVNMLPGLSGKTASDIFLS
ncbi:MAG TPA: 1,4-dihydroxy-6-naphthoate synthase [Chitinophagaceae bacterium]